MSSGTFTMSGGTIFVNTAELSGGGVYVDGGTFTMQGGTISGNTAKTNGGGVYVDGGTFTMSGGTISGNTVTYNFGGGVYVKDGTFAMQGGTISGNIARFGDGVYLGGGMFTMSGGAEISADNGLYPTDNTYIFIPDSGFTGSTLNITNVIAVGYPLIRVSNSLSASDYLSKFKLQSTNHGLIPDGTDKNLTVASINKLTVVNGTGGGRYCTGSPVDIEANTTTGYTFTKWTSNSGGAFASDTAKSTTFTMPGNAVTVTANQRAHTYTVQYNGNGATSGETTNSEHTYDVAHPLTANGFFKTGFTFIGWNKTGTSGTDIDYPDMASVQNLIADDRATVHLYAVWNLVPVYQLTVINGTGGGGSHAEGAQVNIALTEKTGYTFTKWTSNNGGTFTSDIAKSTTFTMPASAVTVTAGLTPITYTVRYDGNGYDGGSTAESTHTYDAEKPLTANGFTRAGFTFIGWNKTSETGTFVDYTDARSVVNLTSNDGDIVTLHAVWTRDPVYPVTVTGGTGGGSYPEGQTVQIIATVPSGQTFDHWETTGGVILDSSTAATTTFVMPAAAVTVTAVFKDSPVPPSPSGRNSDGNMENAFHVLFDTQGGSYVSPATGLSYGDKISKPAVPEKSGYTFGGWYKDAACTQAWAFTEVIPGDMTLYAKWTGGSAAQQTPTATAAATTQPTEKQTTAPVQTQSQGASATTAAPAATTAAGVSPTLTQAPAPVFGALLGLLAAGVLLRRRD